MEAAERFPFASTARQTASPGNLDWRTHKPTLNFADCNRSLASLHAVASGRVSVPVPARPDSGDSR
jgi:hypothetical protein